MSENILHQFAHEIKDDVVFIIGGGPSVDDVDPTDLKDEKVLALNSGFVKFPNAIGVFWLDCSWSAMHDHKLNAHHSKYRFHARDNWDYKDVLGPGGAFILNRESQTGYSPDLRNVSGNNSGSQALNLCINCKPSTIVLLGFDMTSHNKRTHFHDEYEQKTQPHIFTDNFLPNFEILYNEIKDLPNLPKIINASPISKLPHFKIDNYKNYLKT